MQVFTMVRRRRRQMSFEYQGENGVSLRRTNCYAHHTHCSSTQPVACIRGYEPSGASQRGVASGLHLCGLTQATFQAQRQLSYSSTCSRYRKAMQWDHFMTSDISNLVSDAKLMPPLIPQRIQPAEQNKTQYKIVCPLSRHHSSC